MILGIIFLLLSIALTSVFYYFTNLYEIWYYFFVPILCIPVFWLVCFLVYILIILIISLCFPKKKEVPRPSKLWHFWIRETAFLLLLFFRVRVKVIGKECIDPKKQYLIVSNHLSMFDPISIVTKLKLKHIVCVSKKENIKYPICGTFIYKAGYIFLDREDNHAAIHSIRKATEYLANGWSSIYICPEGTRSKTGKLLPFHAGSFKIATKAETDIIVCYIQNTNQVMRRFPFRSTKVTLKILRIIPKEEVVMKKTVELSSEVYEILKKEEDKNELSTV